jgi:hypothetical protein
MAEPCVIKELGTDATGFPGVDYNEKKVAEGVAELVKMKNFGPLEHYQFHAPDTVKKYLQKIADKNDRVQHPQLHIMVSYPGEPTEEEKQRLLKDFEETLDRLGYKGQPILIYAHYDTDHWHLHAVSVRVQQNTGLWINNSFEGVRARRHLDDIRGVEHDKALDKMLNYNFTSKEQFLHILRANGYHFQEDGDSLNVYRACQLVFGVSVSEIEETAEDNKVKNKKNRKKQLDRIRQVRAIISKYRDKSLNAIVDVPELKKTKRGKIHTVAPTKVEVKRAKFQGSDGLELSELKKAQLKKFLTDLKRTAGVELIFHRDKDGKVRGYSVIDNAKGNIFNGSDIMKMSALLNGKNMMEEIIPEELAAEVSQEYRDERNAERDKIDPSNVFDKMMEKLSSMGLEYDYPPLMRPYVSELSALQNCQKAIELITLAETQKENGNENWMVNAQKAVEHAEGAAQMDRHERESKKQAYEPEVKQKRPSEPVVQGVRIIPFVKIEPTIFFGDDRRIYIKADINDKAYPPKALSAEQSAWYQRQGNYEQAAQDLALHYYANEIQEVQVNGWKEQYFEAGKMPFGITVGEVRGHANNQGDRFWVDGDFTHNGQKLKTSSQEVSKNEYVKFVNSEGATAKSVVCKSVGRELVKDWGFNSITDIKNALFDSPSPESSVDSVLESVKTFEAFTELLCSDFMETCGAAAIAYINAILLSGQSIGGGGGGQSTGNWGGKKDDDDLYKRGGCIMGFKSSKKKTGGGMKI